MYFHSSETNLPWYAIRVQSNFETVASTALRGKGYQEFLPLYKTSRRWSDRVNQAGRPLFPGYLFCRFNVQARILPILTTPGVIAIVSAGRIPIPVPDDQIAAVQAVLRSGLPALPWPYLSVGSLVLIERGPLAGLEGIAVNVDKKHRLVVSISMLQRSVAVEVERDWVRPIAPRPTQYVAPFDPRSRLSA